MHGVGGLVCALWGGGSYVHRLEKSMENNCFLYYFRLGPRGQGSLCVGTPSGERELEETVGTRLARSLIELMRKPAYFVNRYAKCDPGSAAAGMGSMVSVFALAL